MTEEEELHLKAFYRFENETLSYRKLHEDLIDGDDDFEYAEVANVIGRLRGKGYCKKGIAPDGASIELITEFGKSYFERLIQKQRDENFDKLDRLADKLVIRNLNNSTLKTNESIQGLNTKTESIYKFQKFMSWLTIGVAGVAALIAFLQYLSSDEKDTAIEQAKIEIQQMNKKLDSLQSKIENLETSHLSTVVPKNASK